MSFNTTGRAVASACLLLAASVTVPFGEAVADNVNIKIQSTVPLANDSNTLLKVYTDSVTSMTGGAVTFEILGAGSIVGVSETLDAVDKGLVDAGFAWTHYWSGKHPAAMLFGSPVAGAGLGIDNIAFFSWYMNGGGRELYDQLWEEMGVNVKGLMLQPSGPEALGWFKETINSMEDFRRYRFRTPPGIPGRTYNDIGVSSVSMGGGDILPSLEKGTIDAAEWCCPKPDMDFGFQKVLKHYYLQGLHQVVVNADLYINRDTWDRLTPEQQAVMETAADASLMQSFAYRIHENGKALKVLTDEHGVELHDTPEDYFSQYMNAARKTLEENAADNAFFKKVWESQRRFAEVAVPYWAGAQTSNANLGRAFARQVAD
ncbi:MAG: C4-dicarboxylate ABC transporter substrate-binding protein [Proteobacteria bacterium]|nr:MAG: C4-dicarboxylate ABC transporter substrate-binding protein [Pseudomonadota bacterium]